MTVMGTWLYPGQLSTAGKKIIKNEYETNLKQSRVIMEAIREYLSFPVNKNANIV